MDSINAPDMDDAIVIIDQPLAPQEVLLQLLKGGMAKITDYSTDYPVGLQGLVETLMRSVRDIPVQISSISYQHGQLEVGYEMLRQRNELQVMKAIEKARRESFRCCQECGRLASRKVRGDELMVICPDCLKALDSTGKTGTWLDKY